MFSRTLYLLVITPQYNALATIEELTHSLGDRLESLPILLSAICLHLIQQISCGSLRLVDGP